MIESCCPSSSESAQQKQIVEETCCEFHPSQKCGPEKCPKCQGLGKTVQRVTLGSLVKPEKRHQIPVVDEFCFCRNPKCNVVYFRPGKVIFQKNDLNVKVGIKEPDDLTVPVCYCFGWTPQKIQAEIETTGKTTAVDQIKTQVKGGNCYCEVTNPQGSCCLGNVSQVIKKIQTTVSQ